MKKLTKKAIAAAPKYMVSIDWKTSYRNTIDRQMLNANNIFDAMKEAESLYNENVYLIQILEKTEEVQENEFLVYEDRMTSRSRGNWHLTDNDHSEALFPALYHVECDYIC